MSNATQPQVSRVLRSRKVIVGGASVVVTAAVAVALAFGGAANAQGNDATDPSIRQLPDGSWIAEDYVDQPVDQPIDEPTDQPTDQPTEHPIDGTGTAPEEMIVEGSDIDPDSDMIIPPAAGQL